MDASTVPAPPDGSKRCLWWEFKETGNVRHRWDTYYYRAQRSDTPARLRCPRFAPGDTQCFACPNAQLQLELDGFP